MWVLAREKKGRGIENGWGFLPNSEVRESGIIAGRREYDADRQTERRILWQYGREENTSETSILILMTPTSRYVHHNIYYVLGTW